jgi:carnosine N-methyltransferase
LPVQNSSYASDRTGYESVSQVLHHLMRDYSERAAETRRQLYEPILAFLSKHLPAGTERQDTDVLNREALRKVLVPGAGMGRLVLEIAGHTPSDVAVEANECSYTMIAAMRHVFNHLLLPDAEAATVYPNLHATGMDDLDHHDRLKGYTIPDPQAKQLVEDDAVRRKISVEFGDFIAIYGNPTRRVAYHAIVTCFFVDTATNVLEYVTIIGRLLSQHGGVWVNAGPLHYHSESAVRYSLAALDTVLSRSGFTLLEQTQVTTTYCGEEQVSMKPEVYQVPIQVWRLTDPSKVLPLPRLQHTLP